MPIVESDGLDEREAVAALVTRELLELYNNDDRPEIALVFAVLCRGNDRLLDSDAVLPFHQLAELEGAEYAWDVAVRALLFRHMDMPLIPNIRFKMDDLSVASCIDTLRFTQDEIRSIVAALPFPETIVTPKYEDRVSLTEAFCIVLYRLSRPNRWKDLKDAFGRAPSALCRIFYYTVHLILERVSKSVAFYPLTADMLARYHSAFSEKGVPDELRIVVVIDNKKVFTCKPTHGQQSQYNRHKKGHGPKFQTLEGPDGLICHSFCGDGRRGDGYICWDSKLREFWRSHPLLRLFRILGDSAYATNEVFVALFKRRRGEHALAVHRRRLNKILSSVRTTGVEWGYDRLVTLWAFLDWKKSLKMEKTPVEALWNLAVWLTNVHTCARRGNQISEFFNCEPPTLETYLQKTLNE